ncbi:MAG: cupin domain-containing protein [Elusimicrobiota bacterium]|nr:cupin domain-containing protein [Elusimicrobiota bacterium]
MKTQKDQEFVKNASIDFETNPKTRKILSFTDDLMLVENHFEKDDIAPAHSHYHTQIVYVVCGVFEFVIEDRKYIISKGDSLLIKSGVKHGCKCIEKGILLDVFTPMREDFIKEK